MARVIRLPDKGRLLVCTDLQGCMRDFQRMVEVFEQALLDYGGDAHLLFTGDLIHGPHIEPEDWPDFLGEYYRDASGELMIAYAGLAAQYPGRVHALLGNHEHGHIGGPHTAKFAADEVALLEHILGPAAHGADARHHPHVRARRGVEVRRGVHARRAGGGDRLDRRSRGRGPLRRRLRQPARRARHAGRRQGAVGAVGDRGRGAAVPAGDAAAR